MFVNVFLFVFQICVTERMSFFTRGKEVLRVCTSKRYARLILAAQRLFCWSRPHDLSNAVELCFVGSRSSH